MLKAVGAVFFGVASFAGAFVVLAMCQVAFVPCVLLSVLTGVGATVDELLED